ncbi:MAG: hypothetical protein IPK21_15525 [Haliscomenobacter sp.]|nr:hypothetical protein [Haliscomenobacter sp.]
MLVLSLHEGHNASAAIAQDGRILAAVSEERFCRAKNFMGFPHQSIMYCLEEAGCEGNDLDRVVLVTRLLDPLVLHIRRSTHFTAADHIRQQYEYYARLHRGGDEAKVRNQYARSCNSFSSPSHYDFSSFDGFTTQKGDSEKYLEIRKKTVQDHLGVPEEKIILADHHHCHAAYAYGASSIREEKVLVFTADCIGDGLSATVWMVDERGIPTKIAETSEQMLGYVWRYVTLNLGLIPLQDEYKVMGLAPYGGSQGGEQVKKKFDEIFGFREDRWIRPRTFGHYFEIAQRLEGFRFDHIAAGLQTHTENSLANWVSYWARHTGIDKVIFSGGMALNVKVNAHLGRQKWLTNLEVPPGGSDESLPIGAGYLYSIPNSGNWADCLPLTNAYLGPNCCQIQTEEIKQKAHKAGFLIRNFHPDQVAELLAQGKIIGRCWGRMEFGPRALGNRSILARADQEYIRKKLNDKIKHRDWWMPFAPIMRADQAPGLIQNRNHSMGLL